jgi:hypothetical protein
MSAVSETTGFLDEFRARAEAISTACDIIAETAPLIEAHNLDLDTVRDALLAEFAPTRAGAGLVPR